jgi:hypothetical protein
MLPTFNQTIDDLSVFIGQRQSINTSEFFSLFHDERTITIVEKSKEFGFHLSAAPAEIPKNVGSMPPVKNLGLVIGRLWPGIVSTSSWDVAA